MVLPNPDNPGARHEGTIFSGHIAGDAGAIGAKWAARECWREHVKSGQARSMGKGERWRGRSGERVSKVVDAHEQVTGYVADHHRGLVRCVSFVECNWVAQTSRASLCC